MLEPEIILFVSTSFSVHSRNQIAVWFKPHWYCFKSLSVTKKHTLLYFFFFFFWVLQFQDLMRLNLLDYFVAQLLWCFSLLFSTEYTEASTKQQPLPLLQYGLISDQFCTSCFLWHWYTCLLSRWRLLQLLFEWFCGSIRTLHSYFQLIFFLSYSWSCGWMCQVLGKVLRSRDMI